MIANVYARPWIRLPFENFSSSAAYSRHAGCWQEYVKAVLVTGERTWGKDVKCARRLGIWLMIASGKRSQDFEERHNSDVKLDTQCS
jgi:hypothetical protein